MTVRQLLPVFLCTLSLSAVGQTVVEEKDFSPAESDIRNYLSEEAFDLTTIRLWPDKAPDEPRPIGAEKVEQKGESRRVTSVTQPSFTLAKPKDRASVPCPVVLVCPGGGYGVVGITNGGVDIINWLAERGIAGAYLKYRVPKRHQGFEMHHHAVQDGQRAMSLLRSQAEQLGIDPEKIGAIGFSAGGNLTAMLATNFAPEDRLYKPVDSHDKASSRPNFAALVAPAYLTDPIESANLRPTLQLEKVARNRTPPFFIASSVTDKFTIGLLHFTLHLREKRVPTEVHIYEKGKHADGINERRDNQWFVMYEDWLKRISVIPDE